MKTKRILGSILLAAIGGLIAVFAYSLLIDNEPKVITAKTTQPVAFANLPEGYDAGSMNFTYAAENTVHAVVHVKTQSVRDNSYRNPIHEFFYGERYQSNPEPVVGFGSGVIVSNDGYIVTNNHVIDNSDEIFVTLNDNREYEAELVGADPSTDLAVIKVDADDLPSVKFGNSDILRLGEWVLAVGNPYNLTSTVTAGIVSAKGRSLGIIRDDFRVESFIQTDAALNRGNSGGALVNLKGELVGINTAILSPSGGYAGNSFAVPVSIVKKVFKDIKEYGQVQRAILGVTIEDVNSELAKENNIKELQGVYINGLREDGAAAEAGIEVGDVITSINGLGVNSVAELQEQISRYRPNEEVTVTLLRKNKKKQIDVVLRNMLGNTEIVRADAVSSALGATFEELSSSEKQKFGIDYGVKISKIEAGKLKSEGIKEGFIIRKVNNQPVRSVTDIKNIISSADGGIYLEGIYPNGTVAYYAFAK